MSKMEHFYEDIPGWFTFPGLYRDMVQRAPADRFSAFVEVGCWKGRSAAFMGVEIVNSGKDIKLLCVDTFAGSAEHADDPDVRCGTLFDTFLHNIEPVKGVVHACPMSSVEAAENLRMWGVVGNSDFVFIDAAHDKASVLADIEAWYPLVRPGGVIAGHDWQEEGVREAVTEFFGRMPGSSYSADFDQQVWMHTKV